MAREGISSDFKFEKLAELPRAFALLDSISLLEYKSLECWKLSTMAKKRHLLRLQVWNIRCISNKYCTWILSLPYMLLLDRGLKANRCLQWLEDISDSKFDPISFAGILDYILKADRYLQTHICIHPGLEGAPAQIAWRGSKLPPHTCAFPNNCV